MNLVINFSEKKAMWVDECSLTLVGYKVIFTIKYIPNLIDKNKDWSPAELDVLNRRCNLGYLELNKYIRRSFYGIWAKARSTGAGLKSFKENEYDIVMAKYMKVISKKLLVDYFKSDSCNGLKYSGDSFEWHLDRAVHYLKNFYPKHKGIELRVIAKEIMEEFYVETEFTPKPVTKNIDEDILMAYLEDCREQGKDIHIVIYS